METTPKPQESKKRKRPTNPDKPVMPRAIKEVHKQVLSHPKYMTELPSSTRWCFQAGCVDRYSWCDRENNKWSRQLWRELYLGVVEEDERKRRARYALESPKDHPEYVKFITDADRAEKAERDSKPQWPNC